MGKIMHVSLLPMHIDSECHVTSLMCSQTVRMCVCASVAVSVWVHKILLYF